jgi:HEAT repeat protein
MSENAYPTIQSLLTSTEPQDLRQGLDLIRSEIARIGSSEAQPLFEMVTAIFYIDPLDRPDLMPVLDEAISLVVGFGEWVIPALINNIDAGDLKAQMAVAQALGRIGADSIKPLLAEYKSSTDPERQTFVLYALGKIKSPAIVQAVPLAIDAAQSTQLELRDTATRSLGKFAEAIPSEELPVEMRQELVEKLQANLADPNAGIRAKAVRSLGKLARYGHLTIAQREALKTTCQLILGTDENFEWDRAYIVRKEAKEVLSILGMQRPTVK